MALCHPAMSVPTTTEQLMCNFDCQIDQSIDMTMAALKEPLEKFHKLSGGAIEAVAELIATMTDAPPPPPAELLSMLKISPEDAKAAAKAKRPLFASKEAISAAVEGLLDGAVRADKYVEKVTKLVSTIETRIDNTKKRIALQLTEDEAMELENKLLIQMEEDMELHKGIDALRKKHDDWRADGDTTDPSKFPSVTVGPEILAFEGFMQVAQRKLLHGDAERKKFFLNAMDDPSLFMVEKMNPHRNKEGGPVSQAQNKRILWFAKQITGVDIRSSEFEDKELIKKLDKTLGESLMDGSFVGRIERAVKSKKVTDPKEKVKVVEGLLSKTIAEAGNSVGLEPGYYTLVFLACVHAQQVERIAPGSQPLDHASQVALALIRSQAGLALFGRPAAPAPAKPPANT